LYYIIDGCNFIKKFAGGSPFDFEGEKKRFISRLNRYLLGKKVNIIVVFDSSVPSFEKNGGLIVIHAGNADERIVSEVEKLKSPASCTVVSDDRALRNSVREKGAAAAGVLRFENLLKKKLDEGTRGAARGGEKPSPEDMSEEDIREWVEYFRH
jgi:predicted RNA-binding protein with PIN domain